MGWLVKYMCTLKARSNFIVDLVKVSLLLTHTRATLTHTHTLHTHIQTTLTDTHTHTHTHTVDKLCHMFLQAHHRQLREAGKERCSVLAMSLLTNKVVHHSNKRSIILNFSRPIEYLSPRLGCGLGTRQRTWWLRCESRYDL